MTDQHPITPPPELVQQWRTEPEYASSNQLSTMVSMTQNRLMELCQKSAQHGADQELEECCDWLHWQNLATHAELIPSLRAARRPKPPSLKEQALQALELLIPFVDADDKRAEADTIRRALEQLDD